MRNGLVVAACILLPAFALQAQAPAPARTLLELLPKQTLAFVGTDDARALGAAWADSPTGRLHATPEFKEYSETFRAGLDDALEEALGGAGLDLETLLEWVDGPVGAAVLDFAPPGEGHGATVTVALLVGIAGHEADALDLLQKLEDGAADEDLIASRSTDGDTDILSLRSEPDADEGTAESEPRTTRLAVHAGTLLILLDEGAPRSDWMAWLMDALDGHGGDSLASRADVKATPAGAGGPDLRGWADLGLLLGQAMDSAEAGKEGVELQSQQENRGVLDRLGIGQLGALALRFSVGHDTNHGVVRLDWPAGAPLRDALAQLVSGGSSGSLLALAPEKPLLACGFHAAWEDLFDAVVRCVMVGGRLEAAQVSAGLAEMHEGMGFDLKDDLLARLDGRAACVVADVPAGEALAMPGLEAPLGQRNMLLALGVSDATGLRELLETLLRSSGLHAARQCNELLGFEVCHVPILPGMALDYALLPDVLLLSASPTLVQDAVRRAATPDLPDLAARKDVVATLPTLPAHPGFVGYADAVEWMLMNVGRAKQEPDLDTFSFGPGEGVLGSLLMASLDAAEVFPDVDRAFLERFYKSPALSAAAVDAKGFTFEISSP
jgi:hypothetical protein